MQKKQIPTTPGSPVQNTQQPQIEPLIVSEGVFQNEESTKNEDIQLKNMPDQQQEIQQPGSVSEGSSNKEKHENKIVNHSGEIQIPEGAIKVGQFIFKPSTPSSVLQRAKLNVKRSQLLYLASNSYQECDMPTIAPYLLTWFHVGTLSMYGNQYAMICKELEDVKFPLLKYMNIWGNQIQSIEGICRMEWPVLQQICLWNNLITSVAPFRRIHAPNLAWLDLSNFHYHRLPENNCIRDHEKLSQFYTPGKKLTRLHITTDGSVGCIAKVEAEVFQSDMELTSDLSSKTGESDYIMKKKFLVGHNDS